MSWGGILLRINRGANFVRAFFFARIGSMKVILQRDIARLGQRGEVKEVADGYAMNVLIKKGDAIQATPAELARWKQKEESKIHKKELASSTFAQLVDAIRKTTIVISGKKSDQKGQLFASIKEADIADAIFSAVKLSVDPKQILITTPVKHTGTHQAEIKQGDKKESFSIEVR
jgi:large subunit ribosomal protein L9